MTKRSTPTLFTIGYEGAAVHAVVAQLVDAGVELLVDVRIRAQSRKPGFSKSTLSAELARAGIEYEHLRALGTPLDIRERFRAKDLDVAREQYRAYLHDDDAAQHELAVLADRIAARPTAILCFERDHRTCHRLVVCEELHEAGGIEAEHLLP